MDQRREDSSVELICVGNGTVDKAKFFRCITRSSRHIVPVPRGRFSFSKTSTSAGYFSFCVPEMEKASVNVHIWNTAGQERFRVARDAHFRNMDGFVVFYDIGDSLSFASVCQWLDYIDDFRPDAAKMVMGTNGDRLDLPDFSTAEAKELADSWGIHSTEVSAANRRNVETTLLEFVRGVKQRPDYLITLNASIENTIARLSCTNLAGEEIKQVDVQNADVKTWAEVYPTLLENLLSEKCRPRFVLPDGSLVRESDDRKSVVELLTPQHAHSTQRSLVGARGDNDHECFLVAFLLHWRLLRR